MKDMVDFVKSFDLHTIIVVGVAFWWLNGTMKELDTRMIKIENDISIIKTVLVMKNIMPNEMCKGEKK